MSRAPRSPGSALKPFIYALAFEEGLAHPETVLFDRPMRYGSYAPENFNLGYEGTVTARKALQMSLNLPAIELLADVGPATFLARLHSAGAEIALPKDTPIGLAIGLGGLGVTLTDLARLYAGFARGGEAPALIERLDGAPSSGRAASPIRWRPIMSRTSCAARRRRPTRSKDGSRSRPAPPTAFATRWRSASTAGRRSLFGSGGRTMARRPASSAARPRRRSCSTPSNGSAGISSLSGRRRACLPRPPAPTCRRPCAICARTRPRRLPRPQAAALKIAFPPDGALIDLGLKEGAPDVRLALKALGGAPPFTWFVNGEPVGEADLRRQSAWKPDGAGFARVSVVDGRGESDAVSGAAGVIGALVFRLARKSSKIDLEER